MSALEWWFRFRFNDDSLIVHCIVCKTWRGGEMLKVVKWFHSLISKNKYFSSCFILHAPSSWQGRVESGVLEAENVCIFLKLIGLYCPTVVSSAPPASSSSISSMKNYPQQILTASRLMWTPWFGTFVSTWDKRSCSAQTFLQLNLAGSSGECKVN